MGRLVAWVLLLAGVVWAVVAGVNWLSPQIEKDISQRVNTAFAERGLLFADAQVQGRQVTVVGDAPDQTAHDKAISTAAQTFGVASVVDGMSVAGVKPETTITVTEVDEVVETPPPAAPANYTLEISKEGEGVVLSGMIPDEASRKVLVKLASDRYGTDKVTDQLVVTEGAPEGWRSAAGTVLFNLSQLEKAHAALSNTEVMVSGEAMDEKYVTQAEESIKKALPTNYKAAIAVDVVEPELAAVESPVEAPGTEVEPAAGEPVVAEEGFFSKWWNSQMPQAASETTAAAAPEATAAAEAPPAAPVAQPAQAPEQASLGCADANELAIHKVMFAFDSAKVAKVYDGTLDKVAGIMKGCDDLKVTVAGHTDKTGSTLYNQWLSEQRAESGVRALRRRGVAAERLDAVGYGETKPVGDNATRAGRAANRRVEFEGSREGLFGMWFKQGPKVVSSTEKADDAVSGTVPSWWDRISGAVDSAEKAVSATTQP